MKIEYTLSIEEVAKFYIDHAHETSNYKHAMRFLYFNSLLFFLLVIIITFDSKGNIVNIIFNIVLLFLTLLILLFRKKIALKGFKRVIFKKLLDDKHSSIFKITKINIDEEKICKATDLSEKNFYWDSIKSIRSVDSYYLIVTSTDEDVIIPKRALEIKDKQSLFIDTILKNTKQKLIHSYPYNMRY